MLQAQDNRPFQRIMINEAHHINSIFLQYEHGAEWDYMWEGEEELNVSNPHLSS